MRAVLLSVCLLFVVVTNVNALSYFGYEDYGRSWSDADKTFVGDSNMCWAAAASNTLAYTGWDAGLSSEDAIFDEFRNHWANEGGYASAAFDFWFYGIDTTWAQNMDVSGGGGYYNSTDYSDYFVNVSWWVTDDHLAEIDPLMHDGYGIGLSFLTSSNMGHALSCYGIEYDDLGNYSGLWIAENNDGHDELIYMAMSRQYAGPYGRDMWVVDGGFYDGWVLDSFTALASCPVAPVPEPATMLLLGLGLPVVYRARRRS